MSGFPQKFYHAVFWPIRILMGFAHPIVHVRGLENIPDGPAVICCNHSSFSDAIWVIVCSHQKRIFRTMAKKSCFRTAYSAGSLQSSALSRSTARPTISMP